MRNWSLLTKCAGQAPIPQAGIFPERRSLCLALTPFARPGNLPFESVETALSRLPRPKTDARRAFNIQSWTRHRAGTRLLAKPKPGDCRAVSLDVLARQVREQATALSDQLEKSAAGVEVVFVCPQVIGQSVDSLREESNLNLRRTGIFSMRPKLGNNCLFLLGLQRHTCRFPSGKTRCKTQKNRALVSTQSKQYSIQPESWLSVQCHRPNGGARRVTVDQGTTIAC